jgi:hypothetical protein
MVQWVATAYVNWNIRAGRFDTYQKYSCLESLIPTAPGTSNCSSIDLCAKHWLFTDPEFGVMVSDRSLNYSEPVQMYVGSFSLLSVTAFLTFAVIGAKGACRAWNNSGWGKRTSHSMDDIIRFARKYLALGTLGVLPCIVLLMIFSTLGTIVSTWQEWQRETSIAFDLDCQAVHIAISPWRQYLDVNGFSRAARIAKTWFNA